MLPPFWLCEKMPGLFYGGCLLALGQADGVDAGFGQGMTPSPRQPGIVFLQTIFC